MPEPDFWREVKKKCNSDAAFDQIKIFFTEEEMQKNGFFDDLHRWKDWANKQIEEPVSKGKMKRFFIKNFGLENEMIKLSGEL